MRTEASSENNESCRVVERLITQGCIHKSQRERFPVVEYLNSKQREASNKVSDVIILASGRSGVVVLDPPFYDPNYTAYAARVEEWAYENKETFPIFSGKLESTYKPYPTSVCSGVRSLHSIPRLHPFSAFSEGAQISN